MQDVYKKIPKHERAIEEKTFNKIVKTYLRHAADAIFDYGEVILPHGCGKIKKFTYKNEAWYDTKTGYIKKPAVLYDVIEKGKIHRIKKLIKIKYYKLYAHYNPFNMCRLYKSKYIKRRIMNEIFER